MLCGSGVVVGVAMSDWRDWQRDMAEWERAGKAEGWVKEGRLKRPGWDGREDRGLINRDRKGGILTARRKGVESIVKEGGAAVIRRARRREMSVRRWV